MSYIGKEPQYTDFLSKFFNGDGTAMTVTLDASPPNEAALLVFIDGVRQDTSAYTVSGYSLTFTGAVPSGTNNVQVVHLGIAQDTQVPVDDSVSTVKIQDDAVTSAKLDTNIAIDGDLTVDTNTLHVDSTNNRVGVGTASPSSALHIKDNIPKVIIEDANNGTGGSSYTPYIEFNANGDNVGSVGFTQNGNYLDIKAENYNSAPIRLFTGGSERMRIDSSGNLQFDSGYGSTATAYGCRAWVNFNGTGTVSIRDSGNVSSITDNGTGYYYINFATAMPDANYSVSFGLRSGLTTNPNGAGISSGGAHLFTSYFGIITSEGSDTRQDYSVVCAQVFR